MVPHHKRLDMAAVKELVKPKKTKPPRSKKPMLIVTAPIVPVSVVPQEKKPKASKAKKPKQAQVPVQAIQTPQVPEIKRPLLPHELTREEFHTHLVGYGDGEQTKALRCLVQKVFSHTARVHDGYWAGRDFRPFHRTFIVTALKNGEKVTNRVLADYADLREVQR